MPKPKQKQKWVPIEGVDPDVFKIPSKTSQAIMIKTPSVDVSLVRSYSSLSNGGVLIPATTVNGVVLSKTPNVRFTPSVTNDKANIPSRSSVPQASEAAIWRYKQKLKNEQALFSDMSASNHASTSGSAVETGLSLEAITVALNPTSASDTQMSTSQTVLPSTRASPTDPLKSNLDIYAPKYVPYWLKAVNESYAITIHAPLLQRIDYDAYRTRFLGADFETTFPSIELPIQRPCDCSASSLQIATYEQYWQERLQNEYAAMAAQNAAFGLFDVTLIPHDPLRYLYRVVVPGLRESTPRIDLGDIVFIRPLTPVLRGSIGEEAQTWSRQRDRLAPGFSGQEHHAVVWAVLRRDEVVIVRLKSALLSGSNCNVIIPLQAHKGAPMWRAVSMAASVLRHDSPGVPWLRSILFSQPHDGIQQSALPKGSFDLTWIDNSLNFEQKRAVQAIIDAKYGQLPFLISGPPGTGKTKTIVETALQLLQAPNKTTPHLLICAPSDAAADTLLIRLSAHLGPQELFRLNSWTRLTAEVPGEVQPYCCLDTLQLYSLPAFETIMAMKIVVTTCRDANMLIAAGLTNEALTPMSMRIIRAIAPAAVIPERLLHWTALLLDEAAQATEPEALIPVSVVAPPSHPDLAASHSPQVIMAGDEHQLGPRLTSTALGGPPNGFDTSGLESSLFQRLFSRPLYTDHPLSRSNGLRPLTRAMLPIIRPPFANLIRNYRSHPAILSTSSSLFYSDTLIPERPDVSPSILSWPLWPKQARSRSVWPVMFHQNTGDDTVESVLEGDGTGSGSLINKSEANIAVNLITDLLNHINRTDGGPDSTSYSHDHYLQEEDIIIMSPFRAQVNFLRQVFRSRGYFNVRIGPLEAFQGLEARVVVLCTTRTRFGRPPYPPARFVSEDKARNLGVIDEPKRFNVAMTRAKEVLLVIGSAEVLTCTRDPCWMSFLGFCVRNDLCCGGHVGWLGKDVGRGKVRMGKLERALRYAESLREQEEEDTAELNDGIEPDSGRAAAEGQQSFKFRLRGKMIDLDEQMFELQIGDEEADVMRQQEDEASLDEEVEEETADDEI